MTRIYLAAAFERKNEMKKYANELHDLGWEVTSTWLIDEVMQTKEEIAANPEIGLRLAQRDLHDIMISREILVFTGEPGRAGHMTEMGAALAWGLKVGVIGPNVNLFCLLAHEHYEDWEDFKERGLGIEGESDSDE